MAWRPRRRRGQTDDESEGESVGAIAAADLVAFVLNAGNAKVEVECQHSL